MAEEDQLVNAALTVSNPNHKADGTFATGNTVHLMSRRNKGFQSMGARMIKLADQYTTREIVQMGALPEQELYDKVSYFDAVCIVHMARAIDRSLTVTDSGADHLGKEREAMTDRIEGKTVQTILTGGLEPVTPEELANATEDEAQAAYDQMMKS